VQLHYSFIHSAHHVQLKGATFLWPRRTCLLKHIAHCSPYLSFSTQAHVLQSLLAEKPAPACCQQC